MSNPSHVEHWIRLPKVKNWDIGGKATGLSALIADGANVPPTWVLDPCFVRALSETEGQDAAISLLQILWAELNAEGIYSVAARSSATGEDKLGSSHAGQFKTVLDVSTFSDLRSAIEVVYRSLERTDMHGSGQGEEIRGSVADTRS